MLQTNFLVVISSYLTEVYFVLVIDVRKLLTDAAYIGWGYYLLIEKVNWCFNILLIENKCSFIFCFYFMHVPLFSSYNIM